MPSQALTLKFNLHVPCVAEHATASWITTAWWITAAIPIRLGNFGSKQTMGDIK